MRSLSSFIIFSLFSLVLSSQNVSATDTGTEVGKAAPAVELTDLTGKNISLASLQGTVVLLNFWSTLCAPCVAEMPSLNRLSDALIDRGLRVIGVSIDVSDKPVREFIAKNNIAFTILLDKDKEVFFDQYAGPSLPATYLIDRKGIIVEKFSGPREWDSADIKNAIVKLLLKR